jgi:hypothetical protein
MAVEARQDEVFTNARTEAPNMRQQTATTSEWHVKRPAFNTSNQEILANKTPSEGIVGVHCLKRSAFRDLRPTGWLTQF